MIAQLLEKKIIDAINAAVADSVSSEVAAKVIVFGAWQTSLAAVVKNMEQPGIAASVYVALGTMNREQYSTPTATFSGTATLSVRFELDITGDLLLKIGEAVEKLLSGWQGEFYQQAYDALDVDGFSVGSVSVQGGNVPQVDFQRKIVTISWPFTLSGTETSTSST